MIFAASGPHYHMWGRRYPSMRELLRPSNFYARFRRRRIVRPTASKVRFQQGALEEHLLPEDHRQHTRAMGPRGDGELEEYSSALAAPTNNETAEEKTKKKAVLFQPYIEMTNLEIHSDNNGNTGDGDGDGDGDGFANYVLV